MLEFSAPAKDDLDHQIDSSCQASNWEDSDESDGLNLSVK